MIALLIAAATSTVVALVGTPLMMSWLRARGIGQPIRLEAPERHQSKAGTPTMGGVVIVLAALTGYLVAHAGTREPVTLAGVSCIVAIVGGAIVGFADDWVKVTRSRNLGLSKRLKVVGLLGVGLIFAVIGRTQVKASTSLSFTRDALDLDLGPWLWIAWAVLLVCAAANAVNLTDGLDGLAAGSATFSFAAYTAIGFWAFRHPAVYGVPDSLDLAVVAAAMAGACAGFLWWNAPPAPIFMGDTGALAIGAGLAALAILTNTHLLLPILGGIFVLETLSVVVQVAMFRTTGRRLLRMAPAHHHLELGGWPETTVLVRLWILAGIFTALGLGVFYADYLTIPGILGFAAK